MSDAPPPESDLPDVGAPARRALESAGITTLDQLAARRESEIAGLHGMGPKARRVLGDALADAGLAFADER